VTARAWAEVDLGAIRANVRALREVAGTELCAVVKAGGYGHGAAPVGAAALDAGATWLAVAQVAEAVELRAAGIDAPVLLLSEPRPGELEQALELRLHLTVCRHDTAAAIAEVAARLRRRVPVHLKVDTGMHRIGVAPSNALMLAQAVDRAPSLDLHAVWTHCAVADEPENPYTAAQLDRFDAVLAELGAHGIEPRLRHAANSAAAIAHPRARLDLVRCGIAVYGIPPAPALDGALPLWPALRVSSEVSFVQRLAAGERVSYGLRYRTARDTVLATVPVGYADGVIRSLGHAGQEVLIGGRRLPIAGTVTMDQIMVDAADHPDVQVGDEVVLLGEQGRERVTPDEWAARIGTISYEVVCAVGPRVERRYVG
jgi:alanine racemase